MSQIIKKVDFATTFSLLAVGESVDIPTREAREGAVRTAATMYSKSKNVRLTVSAIAEPGITKVTRVS